MTTEQLQKEIGKLLRFPIDIQHVGKETRPDHSGYSHVDVLYYRDMQHGEKLAYLATILLKGDVIQSINVPDSGHSVGSRNVSQMLNYMNRIPATAEGPYRSHKNPAIKESMKTKLVRIPLNVPLSVIQEAIKLHERREISHDKRGEIVSLIQNFPFDELREKTAMILTRGSGSEGATAEIVSQLKKHLGSSLISFQIDWDKVEDNF